MAANDMSLILNISFGTEKKAKRLHAADMAH
jgi:hypothetical protein